MTGFVWTTFAPKDMETFEREVLALVTSKKLTYRDNITQGLENVEGTYPQGRVYWSRRRVARRCSLSAK